MSVKYLEYPLQNGFVNNWLVAGPLVRAVSIGTSGAEGGDPKNQIVRELDDPAPGFAEMPIERDVLQVGGSSLTWRYERCAEDHFVDRSVVCPTWQHLRTWAYTRLKLAHPVTGTFALLTDGPARVWINGRQVFQVEGFQNARAPLPFSAPLETENDLVIRFEQVGAGQCRNQVALRMVEHGDLKDDEINVQIPTRAKFPHRHIQFERLFDHAYLEQVTNYRGQLLNLHWAEDTQEELRYAYSIQDNQERVYVEGTWDPDPGSSVDIGHPQRIFERPMWVVLRAPGKEYYEQNLRYERRLPVYIMDNEFSGSPYGTLPARRVEALEDAARRSGNLFAEIAKMALDRWDTLDLAVIRASMECASRQEVGSVVQVAGLLSILYRFADHPSFPVEIKESLEACCCAYPYSQDAAPGSPMNFTSESQSILFHACEVLAGQRFAERKFLLTGLPGREHQQKGEQQALHWLRLRGQGGFLEWNANNTFETNIMALSLLASLAHNELIAELSAVLLDKMLFLIAVNSFKGAYGSTHGRTTAAMIQSARLEATSGITRFLWGMGVYNQHILGTVSLACSTYEYPSFLADLAAQLSEPVWSKERHVSSLEAGADEVNLVTFKTAGYMLSSAQDYRPGQKGGCEHVWQATLGPDAVVFANHPAGMRDSEAHQPGFWLGNGVLPRVAQWKDVLVAVHQLPDEDGLGFTHAFFPTFGFDEYEIKNGWAFARKGSGYLAITAMQGIELVKHAPDGYRELRSYGRSNLWLCHMGQEAQDGNFDVFKRAVLKIQPVWKEKGVQFSSLRGEELAFGWQGPLQVNGQVQPITGFNHIENVYGTAGLPAQILDIRFGDVLMRLNFSD